MTGNGRFFTGLPRGATDGRRLTKPAAAVVLAFALGAGLIGLAGWFIAASAAAGLAVASTFSFLFPSAEVQALAWARTLARYAERISTHQATLDLVGSVRAELFARALRLPRDRVAALRSSELLNRIMVDSDAVENLLLRTSFPVVAAAAAVIGAAAFLVTLSVVVAAVGVGGLLLTGCALVAVGRRWAGGPSRTLVAARAEARRRLIETIDGLPELRSFGAERHAAADVAEQLGRLSASRRRTSALTAGGQSLGGLMADLTLVAVIAVAAGLTGAPPLAAPAFVAVCLVTIVVFEPMSGLLAAVTALARARAASARLTELLPDHTPRASVGNGVPAAPAEITRALQPGETVVVTGPSGSGKTTLLRGIVGGHAPGEVMFVAQDAHVFDTTIRQNLLLADPTAGERSLWRALAAAALDDTVAAFPAALDTPVGPDGAALSGGQRRRLSVAQGLLRPSRLLLLDEPTEGLDSPTAERLLSGVRDYDRTRTLVIALHDRQCPVTPWTPTVRLHLDASASAGSPMSLGQWQ